MTKDFDGITVVVAGGGGGMGRAIALGAARGGASLILLGRDRARLDATATLAREAGAGGDVVVIPADAADAPALTRELGDVDLRCVDVLVNAVGTNIVERAFDQLTPDSWAGMIDSNLTAAFNLSKAFLPAMRGRGNGLIIHIASTAARKPDRSGAAYQASKAGVLALTHAIMEEEWQNGIRATALLPGMTDTSLLDRRPTPLTPEARSAALQPEDVAEACLFVMRLPSRAHVVELQIQPSRR